MRTLLALTATVVACALASPLVPNDNFTPVRPALKTANGPSKYLSEYFLPRLLMPHFEGYDDNLNPIQPESPEVDPMETELDIMDGVPLQEADPSPFYYGYLPGWMPQSKQVYIKNVLADSIKLTTKAPNKENFLTLYSRISLKPEMETIERDSKNFALSPLNNNYYKNKEMEKAPTQELEVEDILNQKVIEQRKTRQNPNWSRQKALVAENLDRLRAGFTQEDVEGTDKPKHIHVLETPPADPAESIIGVALIAAVGAALTMAIIGFVFGWYTLSKKAKAAADVDYPAYGVTGPTVDASGDRKLAQSAHMYHYQHQKQQIIAMEKNGLEHRNGSVSDPESEEENEEGDYTVYECPGFATTGDMEVKNPLFKEDSTPAIPEIVSKVDADKSKPKE